jgi:nucleotide-binding universal stress UspA family protein
MYQRILVPLDGSATADRGLREAIALATGQREKARLAFLYIVDDFSMLVEMSAVGSYQEVLDGLRRYGQEVLEKAKTAAKGAGIEADSALCEVLQGRIADVIVKEARSASCDLIVMGTHGRRGFNRVAMGSDAEQVVRNSPVPVLLAPPAV